MFLVVFQVLQQLEGNLIYPHVVGGSVGLPSIWVLVAVTIGGSVMGVLGMLVFIPLCSVIYALLREDVNMRIGRKEGRSGTKGPAAEIKSDHRQRTGKDGSSDSERQETETRQSRKPGQTKKTGQTKRRRK